MGKRRAPVHAQHTHTGKHARRAFVGRTVTPHPPPLRRHTSIDHHHHHIRNAPCSRVHLVHDHVLQLLVVHRPEKHVPRLRLTGNACEGGGGRTVQRPQFAPTQHTETAHVGAPTATHNGNTQTHAMVQAAREAVRTHPTSAPPCRRSGSRPRLALCCSWQWCRHQTRCRTWCPRTAQQPACGQQRTQVI